MCIPKKYSPTLDFFETEKGIKLIKETFQKELAEKLDLYRVSAPKFLKVGTGLQDDLAGTQKPVAFTIKLTKEKVEIVHSLAKWKRYVLGKFKFKPKTGLYTDMDAIRKDEDLDAIHSIYVDQWDWEKIITKKDRTLKYLKKTVKLIYSAILKTESTVFTFFPKIKPSLPKKIKFIHTEDLESKFPHLSSKEREYMITKKYGAVFLIGIGYPLKSGKPHDLRAADYDDWSTITESGKRGLCGDILVWDTVREEVLELSSMGIRVDKKSLIKQLKMHGIEERKKFEFHKGILEARLPLTIGGGIGQSRLCMLLLKKAHIGEVQSSVWDKTTIQELEKRKIPLL